MFASFWQRFDQGARLTLPFSTAVAFALLSAIAWPLPYLGTVAPPLALIAVYYWAIYRPNLFRPGMAFLIGLLNDALHMLPLGLSALLFVVAHQLVWRQRRFFAGHSFFMLWWGFALTALVVMLASWLLQMLLRWHGMPFGPVLWQTLLAIALFPLPCWVLIRLQRAILSG
jgi:rod shape-determining protein MreD